jgi:HlyD family secretion protein
MNRWLLLVLLLVLVSAGVAASYSLRPALPVQTATVTHSTIREFVDERGKTRLPETHLITMPFGGRVEAIDLVEGKSVNAGDVVARVMRQDLDAEVAEARAAVERLQASIDENADVTVENSTKEQADLFAASMVSTVAAAEARKVAGKSRLDYSEKFLGRTRQLAETGAETQDDLDKAELTYIEDQISYRTDVLTAEALKLLQSASNLMPRIVTEYIARKSLTGVVLEKQRQEAEAHLRQVLLRQERGLMISPVDGVVLERAFSNEQFVAGGTTLLRIGELGRLEIEADILSEDIVNIRTGDAVEIYGPAVGRGVDGIVDRIYPAGFTKISSLGVEQQRVIVIIRFADGVLAPLRDEHDLGVGYRVRVRIFTAEQPAALIVPRAAIFRGSNGGWEVFAVRGDQAEKVAIEVGLMNDEAVEVTAGLSAGDAVILAPESSLQSGMRVSTNQHP